MMPDDAATGVSFVGAPLEMFRVTDSHYADQARHEWPTYVLKTLMSNQRAGGRFNPPTEFGALYCASDAETAWAELHARFAREGINGLPPTMGLLRIAVRGGKYVDLTDADTVAIWGFDEAALRAPSPSPDQVAHCHSVGRAVRPVADYLVAPSARSNGANIPVFADREESELSWDLAAAVTVRVPPAYAQKTREPF